VHLLQDEIIFHQFLNRYIFTLKFLQCLVEVLQGGGYAVGPAIGAALNQVSCQHHIEYA